tara:strand:+ start:674 stop:784 length:111 start_codon:yes stop_codon:yes gene_type:complete
MKLTDLKDLVWDIVESLPSTIYYIGFFLLGFIIGSW